MRPTPAPSERTHRPAAWRTFPPVAAELGLKVTLGIWIDERAFKKPGESKADDIDIAKAKEANEREIRSGIELARRHNNVDLDRGRQRDALPRARRWSMI